jgi:hypothetical protein
MNHGHKTCIILIVNGDINISSLQGTWKTGNHEWDIYDAIAIGIHCAKIYMIVLTVHKFPKTLRKR